MSRQGRARGRDDEADAESYKGRQAARTPHIEAFVVIRRSSNDFRAGYRTIDIWRIVSLMLNHYGDLAEAESPRHAEEPWEVGDVAGVAVWCRVTCAVGQFVNVTSWPSTHCRRRKEGEGLKPPRPAGRRSA